MNITAAREVLQKIKELYCYLAVVETETDINGRKWERSQHF